MPQHKSAKKRLRQSEKKKAVNKSFKSNVNTEIKAIEKLIDDKKLEESIAKLQTVMSLLHKSAKKKIMNLNKAAIKKGGSSINDYKSPDGVLGSFQNFFKVYQKDTIKIKGQSHLVKKIIQNGRSTFYCPTLQT